MNKREIYDESTKNKISLGLISSERKRYKQMIDNIYKLGNFNDKMYASKHISDKNNFLDSFCITDDDGVKFYLTNMLAKEDSEKWLDKKSTNHVIAKQESNNVYSLYEPMKDNPEKMADVYLINDSIFYIHNNMVHQYYDYINGNKKMSIKLARRDKLLPEDKNELIKSLKILNPSNMMQYLNILSNITELCKLEVIEAKTVKRGQEVENIQIKNGSIKELNLSNLTKRQQKEIEIANQITITDLYNYNSNKQEDNLEYEINLDIIKTDYDSYTIVENRNNKYKTLEDIYIIGNKVMSTIYDNNKVTYSIKNEDDELLLTIDNKEENRKNENRFINAIKEKNPTNIIEMLKIADDSEILRVNHTFLAKEISPRTNATIRMENDELVEYIIPESTYEKTKNEITYEVPITDNYQKHPESFQLTKKVR